MNSNIVNFPIDIIPAGFCGRLAGNGGGTCSMEVGKGLDKLDLDLFEVLASSSFPGMPWFGHKISLGVLQCSPSPRTMVDLFYTKDPEAPLLSPAEVITKLEKEEFYFSLVGGCAACALKTLCPRSISHIAPEIQARNQNNAFRLFLSNNGIRVQADGKWDFNMPNLT